MIQNEKSEEKKSLLTYGQKSLPCLYFISETSFKAHVEFLPVLRCQVALESTEAARDSHTADTALQPQCY